MASIGGRCRTNRKKLPGRSRRRVPAQRIIFLAGLRP
jgi:hypothetical protein